MKIRTKVALIVGASVAGFIAGDRWLTSVTFDTRIAEFESTSVLSSMETVIDQFEARKQRLAESIDPVTTSLAAMGPEEPLRPILDRYGLDALFVFEGGKDASTVRVLRHAILDPASREPRYIREIPNQAVARTNPLAIMMDEDQDGGLLVTSTAALLIARGGTEDSQVFVGQILTPERLDEICRLGGTRVDAKIIQHETLTPAEEEGLALVGAAAEPVPHRGEDRVEAWAVLTDLRKGAAILLRATNTRAADELFLALSRDKLISTIGIALLFPLVILVLIQLVVTGPLSRLTSFVVEVGASNQTDVAIGMERNDEIGQLAEEFDRMLELLAQSRAEVVRSARMAGMSDVSANVLHNVGNVLNSVGVSTRVARDKTKRLMNQDLQLVAGELIKHQDDLATYLTQHDRGRHLAPFLVQLIKSHTEALEGVTSEISVMEQGVEHMSFILNGLRGYGGARRFTEKVDLVTLVNSTIELCQRTSDTSDALDIRRDFDAEASLDVDRHKLMEVLINLLRNAIQSIERAGRGGGSLLVRIHRPDASSIAIEIKDDGAGIPREDLARIFQLGVSGTEGGRGLGLHFCSTAVIELGGRIHATSDGPGRGATFVVELPTSGKALPQRASAAAA